MKTDWKTRQPAIDTASRIVAIRNNMRRHVKQVNEENKKHMDKVNK